MLTRLDITNPHGQKFAPGDLVRLIKPSHGHPAGTAFRVIGSNIQVCGSALLFNVYYFDYQAPPKDSYEYHQLFKTYSLVRVETGYSSSWYDEQLLHRVTNARDERLSDEEFAASFRTPHQVHLERRRHRLASGPSKSMIPPPDFSLDDSENRD